MLYSLVFQGSDFGYSLTDLGKVPFAHFFSVALSLSLLLAPFPVLRLPCWLSGKEPVCQCRRHRFDLWVRKIPWRRKWQPTPVSLLGESHGQRSLAGYSPWGHKESNMTEWLTLSLSCSHLVSPFILSELHSFQVSFTSQRCPSLPLPVLCIPLLRKTIHSSSLTISLMSVSPTLWCVWSFPHHLSLALYLITFRNFHFINILPSFFYLPTPKLYLLSPHQS